MPGRVPTPAEHREQLKGIAARSGVVQCDGGQPWVTISCPECGTSAEVPAEASGRALETHNEGRHDGEAVATVDPSVVDRLREQEGGR